MDTGDGRTRTSRDELVALAAQARRLVAHPERVRAGLDPGAVGAPRYGQGMEFMESRPWVAGDDARNMDWRVTARTGRAHTKLFEEEQDQPWIALVDQRPSLAFGTRERFKLVQAARVAAVLLWAGLQLGNRTGAGVLTASGIERVRIRRSRRSVLDMIGLLDAVDVPGDQMGSVVTLRDEWVDAFTRSVPRGAAVFVISDFLGFPDSVWHQLSTLASGAVAVGVQIVDAVEVDAPRAGSYPVYAGRGVRTLTVASDDSTWDNAMAERNAAVAARCASASMRYCRLRSDDDIVAALLGVIARPGGGG